MATWTQEQVDNVGRLWTSVRIDRLMMEDGWLDAVKRRAAMALCEMATTFGVDAHPDDCEFAVLDEAPHGAVEVRCRWNPSTSQIELMGGESDGRVVQVPRPLDRFRVPMQPNPTVFDLAADADPTLSYVEYVPAGWRESERRWVFAPVNS